MTYYLAIDQGTHASRACLFDEAGVLLREHTKNIRLTRISSTHIEQDANEIIDSVNEVVAQLLHELQPQDKIAACGIAIQRSSVLAWQSDGTAIGPVLSWQDTRGSQQLDQLRKAESEIQQLSGLPLSAHYGASKLHYLQDEARTRGIATDTLRLSPLISYLLFHILEEHPYIVDHTNAQRTQLFSIAELDWSARLAELFEVPLQTLPGCVPVLNRTSNAHGKLAGTDIPVTAISGDQNAAIFDTGSLPSEAALVNLGSGAFVLSLLPHYQASKKQLSTIANSENSSVQYLREATINGAGSALDWLQKKYDIADLWQQLPVWLNTTGSDETGLPPIFINSIGGLGSPWWNNSIEAEFIVADHSAIGGGTEPSLRAVAVIESIVFMVCINLEIMQSELTLKRLRVCGGLSLLDGLCQRLADLSALPVERLHSSEATARGIAWLAAGKPDDWSSADAEIFTPQQNAPLCMRYAMFSAIMNGRL
ncbi:MAG: hypothetical protein KJN89_10405 [Gammaproteobacteria bacterium]|nr:hypothetical protein [Gammaproteobacteria bacterium]MBT8135348.1 hypothetical protein [Gammaproteobacteria bacterium]NNJ50777.1 hypothetical protein [Gammaproteobacteria bacterium]